MLAAHKKARKREGKRGNNRKQLTWWTGVKKSNLAKIKNFWQQCFIMWVGLGK